MNIFKKRPTLSQFGFPTSKEEQVIWLIDWENLWYSLMTQFGVEGIDLSRRIQAVKTWLKKIGDLLGGHGYVFAPEHLSAVHQQICVDNGLWIITCPKKQLLIPQENPKTGRLEERVDTVDQTIMDFAKAWLGHPNFKTICLVSGDKDYIPLFEELAQHGIRRALALPTLGSLSRDKKLLDSVDTNLATGRKMLLMLDRV
ncbi:MAG: NYN domain-containing protein [Candidatus Staskawiczbacteria bacterium]|jgi:hypothetical protein